MAADSCCGGDAVAKTVSLEVNGDEIRINPFVKGILSRIVLGVVASLKGVENPEKIVIRVER